MQDTPRLFEAKQRHEWLALQRAIDEAPEIVPCTNWPDVFYPDVREASNIEISVAKNMCHECPIRTECLTYALRWEDQGIWGGMSAQERRKLRNDMSPVRTY